MTPDADLLEQYAALDTPTVSDALDNCGLPPGQGGLPPMWGRPRIAGFAATVELEPLTGEHPGAHVLTEVIAQAGAENVIVIANGGRTDVSSWGGIVSVGAAMRSIRGVITDGACRASIRPGTSASRCSRGPRSRSPPAAGCGRSRPGLRSAWAR